MTSTADLVSTTINFQPDFPMALPEPSVVDQVQITLHEVEDVVFNWTSAPTSELVANHTDTADLLGLLRDRIKDAWHDVVLSNETIDGPTLMDDPHRFNGLLLLICIALSGVITMVLFIEALTHVLFSLFYIYLIIITLFNRL
jgi:hypothetical protein